MIIGMASTSFLLARSPSMLRPTHSTPPDFAHSIIIIPLSSGLQSLEARTGSELELAAFPSDGECSSPTASPIARIKKLTLTIRL